MNETRQLDLRTPNVTRTNASPWLASAALIALVSTTIACSGGSDSVAVSAGDGGGGGNSFSDSGGDGGLQPAACNQVNNGGSCEITPTEPSLLANAANICMQEGGTPGTTCPTTNLVGCCTIDHGEQCYYTNSSAAAEAESDCTGGGGSWTTHL